MTPKSPEFLINRNSLRLTIYLSLTIANIIFGVIHPEQIAVAVCGFAFFAALTLFQLRAQAHKKQISTKNIPFR